MLVNPEQANEVTEGVMRDYWRGFDSVARTSQPQVKMAARSHIELSGFWSKRLKANIELPQRLARCKTPVDLFGETVSYWMQAFEDYAETSQRAAQILGMAPFASEPRITDWQPPQAVVETVSRDPERDVMDLDAAKPETKEDRAAEPLQKAA